MVLEYKASGESAGTEAGESVDFAREQTPGAPPALRPPTRTGGTLIRTHTGEPLSGTYAPSDAARLERQLTLFQAQYDGLEADIRELRQERDRAVAHVAGDDVALFILAKIVQAGVLDVSTLAENLTAPHGWLAFAQLTRALLVDCIGDEVVPTDAGERLLMTILGDSLDSLFAEDR